MKKNLVIKILKIAAIIIVYGYLGYKIHTNKELLHEFKFQGKINILLIVSFSVLWLANILLESWKWIVLNQKTFKLSLAQSIQSVFTGFSLGLFSTNRIGEWFGRVIHFPQDKVKTGIYNSVYGSIWQNIIIGVAGIIFLPFTAVNVISTKSIIIVLLILILLLIFIFFHNKILEFFQSKIHSKRLLFLENFNEFSHSQNLTIALLTLIRLFTFALQFAIALKLFCDIQITTSMATIFVYYLVITFVPSFTLLEPGLRISVAAIIFSGFTDKFLSISLAILAVWIINVALPAVMGTFYFFRIKQNKKQGVNI